MVLGALLRLGDKDGHGLGLNVAAICMFVTPSLGPLLMVEELVVVGIVVEEDIGLLVLGSIVGEPVSEVSIGFDGITGTNVDPSVARDGP